MDELKKPRTSLANMGASHHYLNLFVFLSPLLRPKLRIDVSRQNRLESE